jgi:nitrogen regulatory protein PII
MFVLDNPELLDDVLAAWQTLGVSGITIMESSGFHRRQAHLLGARFASTLPELSERIAQSSYTLFAAVATDELVEHCFDAAETVVGNLHEPNTGVILAWPLTLARGLEKRQRVTEAEQ